MTYAPHQATLATPIGPVTISGDSHAVHGIRIGHQGEAVTDLVDAPHGSPVAEAMRQIKDYFAGVRQGFDLPLVSLVSARGEALRQAIAAIPYGETMSYGALANSIDSAARAVGGACRRNPYPIIIPCHRVTSSNGAPEHYSGGDGPTTKAWLIAHERRHAVIKTSN